MLSPCPCSIHCTAACFLIPKLSFSPTASPIVQYLAIPVTISICHNRLASPLIFACVLCFSLFPYYANAACCMLRHGSPVSVAGAFQKSNTLQMTLDDSPVWTSARKSPIMRIPLLPPYSSDQLSGVRIASMWRRFSLPQGLVADPFPCTEKYYQPKLRQHFG